MLKCKICSSSTDHFCNATVMNKYEAIYNRCANCGCIFIENPYWLNEAYTRHIPDSADQFQYQRAIINTNLIFEIIQKNNLTGYFVDYGCGSKQLFINQCKLNNIIFHGHDPYTNFNLELPQCALITAFEVLEHFQNPLDEFNKILTSTSVFVGSTGVLNFNNPQTPHDWAYYALEWGQHIILYTIKTLKYIAELFLFNLYCSSDSYFVFSKNEIVLPQKFNLQK